MTTSRLTTTDDDTPLTNDQTRQPNGRPLPDATNTQTQTQRWSKKCPSRGCIRPTSAWTTTSPHYAACRNPPAAQLIETYSSPRPPTDVSRSSLLHHGGTGTFVSCMLPAMHAPPYLHDRHFRSSLSGHGHGHGCGHLMALGKTLLLTHCPTDRERRGDLGEPLLRPGPQVPGLRVPRTATNRPLGMADVHHHLRPNPPILRGSSTRLS